jgi:uncharacterized protein YecT (DUF1311 family)
LPYPEHYKGPFLGCLDKARAGGNANDLFDCTQEGVERQDDRLNVAYEVAMSIAGDRQALKAAQKNWIETRDKECTAQGRQPGGADRLQHLHLKKNSAARLGT